MSARRNEAAEPRAQPHGPALAEALHRSLALALGLAPQGVDQGRVGPGRKGLVQVFGAHGGLLVAMNEGVNGL
jgi:hypothetical protein